MYSRKNHQFAETQSGTSAVVTLIIIGIVVYLVWPSWKEVASGTRTFGPEEAWVQPVQSSGQDFRVTAVEANGVPFSVFYLDPADYNVMSVDGPLSQAAISKAGHNSLMKNGQLEEPREQFFDRGTVNLYFYNGERYPDGKDITVSFKIEVWD